MFKTQKYYVTATPIGGAVSFNTPRLVGELVFMHVKPVSSNNQYTLTITDSDGLEVWATTSPTQGEVAELIEAIPIDDILQVAITGATINEQFEIKFRMREDIQNR